MVDKLAKEAEDAAHQGNTRELFDSIKMLSGKFSNVERPVKDKRGNTLPSEEQQRGRWKEHFEELLNRPEPRNPRDIQQAANDLLIDCNTPT